MFLSIEFSRENQVIARETTNILILVEQVWLNTIETMTNVAETDYICQRTLWIVRLFAIIESNERETNNMLNRFWIHANSWWIYRRLLSKDSLQRWNCNYFRWKRTRRTITSADKLDWRFWKTRFCNCSMDLMLSENGSMISEDRIVESLSKGSMYCFDRLCKSWM